MKYFFTAALLIATFNAPVLSAHCQMPCGIYHDDMVYDQIDQYVETMIKGVTVLNDSKFTTPKERNDFCRWVMNKDRMSDETATLITTYFLQQKIKPGEVDTTKRLISAHNMLFYLMTIKQTVDQKYVEDFSNEWDKFKLMFHVDGYECKMEKIKLTKWGEKKEAEEKEAQGQTGQPHIHDNGQIHTH